MATVQITDYRSQKSTQHWLGGTDAKLAGRRIGEKLDLLDALAEVVEYRGRPFQ